jgi:hypothetical protein
MVMVNTACQLKKVAKDFNRQLHRNDVGVFEIKLSVSRHKYGSSFVRNTILARMTNRETC